MGYAAIESVEKAVEDTKELLFPFDLGTWSKLAVIAVLAGGLGGFNFPSVPSGGSDYDTGSSDFSGVETDLDQNFNAFTGAFVSPHANLAVAGIVILVIILFLGFMYISSVFEFIYYQSLNEKDVKILENFKDNTGNGFSLFSFRILWMFLLLSVLAAGVMAVVFQPLAIIPLIFLALPLLLLSAVVNTFVNTFVILRMLESGDRFIDSARFVYAEVSSQWKEFALFFVMEIGLGMAVSIIVGLGAFVVLVALALPLTLIGTMFYLISKFLVIPVLIIGVFVWLAVILIGLTAPTSTFLYYYSVEVYQSLIY